MRRIVTTGLLVVALAAPSAAQATSLHNLTAAQAAEAVPFPVLPILKIKADEPVRTHAGSGIVSSCLVTERQPGTLPTPAYTEARADYELGSVAAGVLVYAFSSPSAATRAWNVVAHDEHVCPPVRSLIGGAEVDRQAVNAKTVIAGWTGWQHMDRDTNRRPGYRGASVEVMHRGNVLLIVGFGADSSYGGLTKQLSLTRRITAAVIATLDTAMA